ncbi:MAG: LeuA family protein [Thermodesulfobacteriota bacterium]
MVNSSKNVIIKDSTLREGLDVPNVSFSLEQKLKIVKLLDIANVAEIEIVAPSRVLKDLEFVKRLNEEGLRLKTSGLIYSYSPRCREEIEEAIKHLNRFDLLMPVSPKRKPYDRDTKIKLLLDVLAYSLRYGSDVGVGFPHSTQTEVEFLLEISKEAVMRGAKRVTVYDTNGSSDPFTVYDLIKQLREKLDGTLFFHGHNDLGLATANSLAAVYAGADGLDVTINGLGDRAGNASFEQIVLVLHLRGYNTGVTLKNLRILSKTIEEESGVEVSKLAPIVGEYIFSHKSPSHLEDPELFEPFDPRIVDSYRRLSKS